MEYDDIRELSYKPSPKAATRTITKGIAARLISFQKMYWEYNDAGKTMVGELLTFTTAEFEKYELKLHRKQVADPNFQVSSPPPTISRTSSDPIQDFKKGVRRDPTSFPTLKNIKQWDNWN